MFNWEGIIGSVGDVICKLLPVVLPLLVLDEDGNEVPTPPRPVPVGPATLIGRSQPHGNSLWLVNATNQPVHVDFSVALGEGNSTETSNVSAQIVPYEQFDITPFLQTYALGGVVVGSTAAGEATDLDGGTNAIWTWATKAVFSVLDGTTFKVAVETNNVLEIGPVLAQTIKVSVIAGSAAIFGLGVTYLIVAKNNAGQTGSTTGTPRPAPAPPASPEGDLSPVPTFVLDLPQGVDYSNGIYDFVLQLPLPTRVTASSCTSRSGRFEKVTDDDLAAIRATR